MVLFQMSGDPFCITRFHEFLNFLLGKYVRQELFEKRFIGRDIGFLDAITMTT